MNNYKKINAFLIESTDEMEQLYKINLMDSISGYKSANLVAIKSENGVTNLAILSSVVHSGFSSAILGFVLCFTKIVHNSFSIKKIGF